VIQLLQWLQCFSSMGEDLESLKGTMEQMNRLTPQQLLHAVKHYRAEVGEKLLSRECMRFLVKQSMDVQDWRKKIRPTSSGSSQQTPTSPTSPKPVIPNTLQSQKNGGAGNPDEEEEDAPENLLFDPALMLPFVLPTSTDMLVSFGAGMGGVNRERERKYLPFLPVEFLNKLDALSGSRDDRDDHVGHVGPQPWDDDDDDDD